MYNSNRAKDNTTGRMATKYNAALIGTDHSSTANAK